MSGLWRYRHGGGKYLVQRRDGSIPQWPYIVLGARDPAAAGALRYYADLCEEDGRDPEYATDVRRLAEEFDSYRQEHGDGDPDAPPDRGESIGVVSAIARTLGACLAALLVAVLLLALPAGAQTSDARARAFLEAMLQQVPPAAPIVGLAAVGGPPPYSAFTDPQNPRVSVYILGERQVVRYPMRDVPWTGDRESLEARYGPGYPGWQRLCQHIPHIGAARQVMAGEVLAWAGFAVTAQGAADLEATCPPLYSAYFAAHPLESSHGGEGVGVSCLIPRPYTRTPREALRCRLFPLNGICHEWTGWTPAYPECCPGVQCPTAPPPPPPPPPPLPCDGGAPDGACTPREAAAGTCPEDCRPEPPPPGGCEPPPALAAAVVEVERALNAGSTRQRVGSRLLEPLEALLRLLRAWAACTPGPPSTGGLDTVLEDGP